MLKLLSLGPALSAMQMGTIDADSLTALAKGFEIEFNPEQATAVAALLNNQDFAGSLSEYLMSGKWLQLFAGDRAVQGEQILQCRHCGLPNYI